ELEFTAETPVTGDITVYAKWTGEHYTVTFKWWAGETKEVKLEYPQTLSSDDIPEVGARTNYTTSDGLWYYTNGEDHPVLSVDTVITGNITATPNWVGNSYTVNFYKNDGQSNDPTRVNAKYPNDSPEANPMVRLSSNEIPTVSWENYIFDGWLYDDGSQAFSTDTVINRDMDVYAYWMGLNAAVVKYGTLSNSVITSRSVSGTNYSIKLKVPSFVALGNDTVTAAVTPVSRDNTENTPLAQSQPVNVTSSGVADISVTSPVTSKTYTYKVTVENKTLDDTQMAEGGEITYVRNSETPSATSTWDEVHTFKYSGNSDQASHTFKITRRPDTLTGKVLIVAGGGSGGMGGNSDRGGGGGAGGVQYTESDIDMPAINTAVTVKVGKGGTGSIDETGRGNIGNDSSFGFPSNNSPTAKGGGGGGSGSNDEYNQGLDGGSGGGSGGSNSNDYNGGSASTASFTSYTRYGNAGGKGSFEVPAASGGSGGGAKKAGTNGDGAKGGEGLELDISGSKYTYAKGGNSGSGNSAGSNGTYFGDGGSGGGNSNKDGGAGKDGVVIVRFLFSE
ncbi:MAG: hypothetical protein LBC27_00250, partial [Spirochaetaceae bacterium]|nr:hypothetical protein [Spirochaetaceae bacterium]